MPGVAQLRTTVATVSLSPFTYTVLPCFLSFT